MNRHVGIIGGLILLLIILTVFLYNQYSDFDSHLIEQVDDGVPASDLYVQIDEETQKMNINAKRRLQNVVMDRKKWGDGSLAQQTEYNYYVSYYESELKIISDYDKLRKKYASREITRQEFLDNLKIIKQYFSVYS